MRSEESLRKRAEYAKAWRQSNPNYHKDRRRAKADLLKTQRAEWRAENPQKVKAQRQRYAERHPTISVPLPPLPALHTGHPLFDIANKIVKPIAPMTLYQSQQELDIEDAKSEAILAILEGNDPALAAQSFLKAEVGWRRITAPIIDEGYFVDA